MLYTLYFSVCIGPDYWVFDRVIVSLVAIVKAMVTLFTSLKKVFFMPYALPTTPNTLVLGLGNLVLGEFVPNLLTDDATRGFPAKLILHFGLLNLCT